MSRVSIGHSVKEIKAFAFSKCGDLESIKLPASLETLDLRAFEGCNGVKSIKVDSANKQFDSRKNCNAIIETPSNKLLLGCDGTFIPEGISTIGENAFALAKTLNSVTLPKSLLAIEDGAFSGCVALVTITALMENPFEIVLSKVFPNSASMTLCVPAGTKEYYLAKGWDDFNEIVEIN